MSVYVYLNDNIRSDPDFTAKTTDQGNNEIRLGDISLSQDPNGLYVFLYDEKSRIPPKLKSFVRKVSCREHLPYLAHREAGIYRHKGAVCELVPEEHGGKRDFCLQITAGSMRSLREILHLIKTGAIRPEESYEAPQLGKSHQQLEEELAEANEKLAAAQAEIRSYERIIQIERGQF